MGADRHQVHDPEDNILFDKKLYINGRLLLICLTKNHHYAVKWNNLYIVHQTNCENLSRRTPSRWLQLARYHTTIRCGNCTWRCSRGWRFCS